MPADVELGLRQWLEIGPTFTHRKTASALAQLTVLARPSVVAASALVFGILLGLAADAQAHARHHLATRLGNGLAAFLTMSKARAPMQTAAGALHRIVHRTVDLFLNRAVSGPPIGHG
jgi:hypothetical protein